MAHYAWFNGCTSRAHAAVLCQVNEQDRISSGPELESTYTFPLLWLAGFAQEDQLMVEATMRAPGDAQAKYQREFLVLCASATNFVQRLRQRRTEILRLLPQQFEAFYDEWIAFITAHYHEYVLLNTSDIFAMDDDAVCGERLLRSLQALESADRGENVTDIASINWATPLPETFMSMRRPDEEGSSAALGWRHALAGYSGYRERDPTRRWPGPPTEAEIHAAEDVPMETVHYAETYFQPHPHYSAKPAQFREKLERLLAVLSTALLGSLLILTGLVFSAVGVVTPGAFLVIGIALIACGAWLLRRAWKHVRNW